MALALGRTVGELERELSGSEFLEWQVFDASWPIGERRLDLNFAQLCSVVAQTSYGGSKLRMNDFILCPDEREPVPQKLDGPITDEQLRSVFGSNVRRITSGKKG